MSIIKAALKDSKDLPEPKPQFLIKSEDRPATVRELAEILAAKGDLFNRGDVLVQVLKGDDGVHRTKPMSFNNVIVATHDLVQPAIMDAKGKTTKDISLPDNVAKMYLDLGAWGVPPLAGISTTPLLRADGSIMSKPGYDAETQTWCDCNIELDIPEEPTIEDAKESLAYIRWMYRTFPFADSPMLPGKHGIVWVDTSKPPEMNESSFLAGKFTACARPSLRLAPGLLLTAPATSGSGAGKGLLLRAACSTAFPYDISPSTRGYNRAEMEKRFVASLIEGDPVVFIDNINGAALRSETLSNVMTERPSKVRVLGLSKNVLLNSAAFVALTGNGLTLAEDLARRYLHSHLDPKVEDAESRPFKAGFLLYVKRHRVQLLEAVFTILRWGRQNADKLKRGKPLGSYEQWCEWVRDPLLALGCQDPVVAMLEAKAADPQRRALRELFDLWFKRHEDDPVAQSELDPEVMELLNPSKRERQWVTTRLGQLDGTRAGGYVLESELKVGRWSPTLYTLKKSNLSTNSEYGHQDPMTPMPRGTLRARENGGGDSNSTNSEYSYNNSEHSPRSGNGASQALSGEGHRGHRGHRGSINGSGKVSVESLINRPPAEKRRRAAALRRRIQRYDEMDNKRARRP